MDYISIRKFSERFDIGTTNIRAAINHGILKSKKFGKKILIDAEDFQERLEDNQYESVTTGLLRQDPSEIDIKKFLFQKIKV